jgi:LDH2 family malate/lactate/ureidoglycolate dehydrogenase
MPEVAVEELRSRAVARLVLEGVRQDHAEVVVDHMLTADLWGRTSHGLSVRFEYTLHQAEAGAGRTAPELVLDQGHLAVVSGHNGFGSTSPGTSPRACSSSAPASMP